MHFSVIVGIRITDQNTQWGHFDRLVSKGEVVVGQIGQFDMQCPASPRAALRCLGVPPGPGIAACLFGGILGMAGFLGSPAIMDCEDGANLVLATGAS